MNLKAVSKHWGCAVSRGKWLICLKKLANGWADSLSLQHFKVNYQFQMYLLEVFSFICNFLVCSEIWLLSWILVPRIRVWLLKLWMSWALCPNELVYSWLVLVFYPYIAPDVVQAMCPFSTQRWRLSPSGAAAVVPAVLIVACWLQGLLSPLVAAGALLGWSLLVAGVTHTPESDCCLHCHDQFCLAVEFLIYY